MISVRVESFTREEECPKRRDVSSPKKGSFRILALYRPDRGWGGEEPVHGKVLDDAPKRPGIGGTHGLALEHHARSAADERRVDDV